jgi:cleavage and polyadenylation specificity factor subunit 4
LQCRFKHTRQTGPPPDPENLEAAKPREHRNLAIVANQANENIMPEREARPRRPRGEGGYGALPGPGGGGGGGGMQLTQYGGGGGGGGQQMPGFVDQQFLASVGQRNLSYGF